jgi:hypothetical protein
MTASNYSLAITNAQYALDRDPNNREATTLLSQAQEALRKAEQPVQPVVVVATGDETNLFGIQFVRVGKAGAKGAWLAKTELSWKDYKNLSALMGQQPSPANGPNNLTDDNLPASFDNSGAAIQFVKNFSEYVRKTPNSCPGTFSLPTANDYRACVSTEISADWNDGGVLSLETLDALRNEQENIAMADVPAQKGGNLAPVTQGKDREGLLNILGNAREWTSEPGFAFGVSYFVDRTSQAKIGRRLVSNARRQGEYIGLRLMYQD